MPDPSTGLPVVGMVGAGQLARMTHQAAIALGLSLRVLADSPTDGAALVAADVEIGAADDLEALQRFSKGCDVVTFDHEHVPGDFIRELEAAGYIVAPGAGALLYAQDKREMRQRLAALGLPIPAWSNDPASLPRPFVAKAVRGGYDGRGVWLIEPDDELPDGVDLIVEEQVNIRRELAIQVARSRSGAIKCWPVVETVQVDGICVEVIAPAPSLPESTGAEAERIARTVATELDVVGLLAVELFETPTGLIVNELAMRPHNSGHWSIEGSVTSQFGQHLRAVLDWPLGDTSVRAPVTVMANLLGGPATDLAKTLPQALREAPDVAIHLYGKTSRPGRKIGHATAVGEDLAETRARARRAVEVLREGSE